MDQEALFSSKQVLKQRAFCSRKRQSLAAVLLSLVSLVICLGTVGYLCYKKETTDTWTVVREEQDNENIKEFPETCIDCQQLNKAPYNSSQTDPKLNKLTKKAKDGIQMCCATTSEQMSIMFEVAMRSKENPPPTLLSHNPGNFTFSPASAHKRLMTTREHRQLTDADFSARKPFTLNLDASQLDYAIEHVRGVNVTRNGLVVLHSGLYYVYNSIYFVPDTPQPCGNFRYQTWAHYVLRIRPRSQMYSGTLLRGTHTCCRTCIRDHETSYIGGLFYLQAGDLIEVRITAYGLVYFSKQSSFVGVVMLGSGHSESRM